MIFGVGLVDGIPTILGYLIPNPVFTWIMAYQPF